jgi:exodeoxyribonuclease V alpha subunit
MVFLQSHGIQTSHAVRIFKTYGAEAEERVTENPYRLAEEVFGIGFKSADRIAHNLGIPKDSPRRAEAGVLHVLGQSGDQGHVFLPRGQLTALTAELLEIDEEGIHGAIDALVGDGRLVSEELPESADTALFTAVHHAAETALAARIGQLLTAPSRLPDVDVDKAIEWFERREKLQLAPQQREAIGRALEAAVLVITGGPGTGKTTLLRGIVEILAAKGSRILLAAPTGRAARRLAEATSRDARTVHRMLEYDPRSHSFARGADLPLDADLVIVDEASMLDLSLARSTLAAVPLGARVVLVGDVDQLPSVGPGRVLADCITSGAVPVVRLTEIFRQAAESRIITNAHRINHGEPPVVDPVEDPTATDFFFFQRDEPEEVEETLIHLITERIPRGFGFDPLTEIQVLSPMNRGLLGVYNLNHRLQACLNPRGKPLGRSGPTQSPPSSQPGQKSDRPNSGRPVLRIGDKVMQVRNNYDLDVFNGDVGRIESVDEDQQLVKVRFDDRLVLYGYGDLDELVPAYACSIHKSQGSEYPCVVVPLHTQHYRMLQRNLLYTALTRAEKLAVLVGQSRALMVAVRNQDTRRRFTRLAERLRQLG